MLVDADFSRGLNVDGDQQDLLCQKKCSLVAGEGDAHVVSAAVGIGGIDFSGSDAHFGALLFCPLLFDEDDLALEVVRLLRGVARQSGKTRRRLRGEIDADWDRYEGEKEEKAEQTADFAFERHGEFLIW